MFHESRARSRSELPAGKAELHGRQGLRVLARRSSPDSRPNEVTTVTAVLKRMTDMSAQGMAQRLDARAHELRGQPAQHAREPDDDVARPKTRTSLNEQIANKDNRILD